MSEADRAMTPGGAPAIFSRRALAWLVIVGCAAFCAMLALAVVGDPVTADVTKSSVYSRSALGHSALAELLKARGHEVRVNRDADAARIAEADLVLVLEPDQREADIAALSRLLAKAHAAARPVLVALPKRVGAGRAGDGGWIRRAHLLPKARVARVARALPIGDAEVAALGDVDAPPAWHGVDADAAPQLVNVQLLEADGLRASVAAGERILLGAVARPEVYKLAGGASDAEWKLQRTGGAVHVLADPDLLANHGLHRGANAGIVLTAIERLLPERGVVVFDETLHGLEITPDLWRLLFQPPYLAATLLALAALALTVWHAGARFGAPLAGADGPVFRGGHATLIENAGRLLTAGGHDVVVARRYGEAIVADALGRLRLGSRFAGTAPATATLNAIGARRGLRARLPAAADHHRPLALAKRYQRWSREMFDDA